MGRIADLAEKKVKFSTKNNGNTGRSLERFSCCASGHRRGVKRQTPKEHSMPAQYRN